MAASGVSECSMSFSAATIPIVDRERDPIACGDLCLNQDTI
jgi:hypothetical protein